MLLQCEHMLELQVGFYLQLCDEGNAGVPLKTSAWDQIPAKLMTILLELVILFYYLFNVFI